MTHLTRSARTATLLLVPSLAIVLLVTAAFAVACISSASASQCTFLEFTRVEPVFLDGVPSPVSPCGLAWDGQWILASPGDPSVISFRPELGSGSVTGFHAPSAARDICYLDGAIYGYSTKESRFERWDREGYEVLDLPWADGQGYGITSDGELIYMSVPVAGSDHNLAVFDSSGTLVRSFRAPELFSGLAYTMGELYGLDGWTIYRMTTDGQVLGSQTIPLLVGLGTDPTGGLTAYHRFLILGFPALGPYQPVGTDPQYSHFVELEIVWTRAISIANQETGAVITWDCDPAYSGYRVLSADKLAPEPLWQVRYQILGVPPDQRTLQWTDTNASPRRTRFYKVRAIE